MRLIQRAILWELLRVFGFLLAVLTILLVFVGVAQRASEEGLGAEQIAQILPYIVPSLMPFTIPATLLLSVCIVYGRMGGDQEVIAAKAAGAHVFTLLAPAFLLAAALSISSFVLTDRVIPWAMANIQKIVSDAMEDLFLDFLRTTNRFSDPERGLMITARAVEGKTLIGPQFRYAPAGRSPVTVTAERANVSFDLEENVVRVEMHHGLLQSGGRVNGYFEREVRSFPLGNSEEETKPRHRTTTDLFRQLDLLRENTAARERHAAAVATLDLMLGELPRPDRLAPSPPAPTKVRIPEYKVLTEIYSRPAMAASCLFFALIGGTFSIKLGRSSFLTTFMICFVPILLVYYPITLGMLNLAKHGDADPRWTVWVGNLLIGAWGLITLRQVARF
ncbi:LptF/LptG family permease [Alienimonas californiensis]|uniref:Putative permease YjgP/YjgQ family protein n=1 Tax=Alienimonas californiensis TaxID=2527989 RepID=A0A517PCX2_9PLAN|nr:LptF/LptG family permease [Alienimonas californiensis]QDT17225.1 putative permease YjgP/YjgQ family protein [Alienimonas californiensis]